MPSSRTGRMADISQDSMFTQQALYFVLIVHTVQTLLVVLLGVWAWAALAFTKVRAAVHGHVTAME